MFASDAVRPITILLVSGDGDFAYAAATLRLRQHRVVVVAPSNNSHVSLRSQAVDFFDWDLNVLEKSASKLAPSLSESSQPLWGMSPVTGPTPLPDTTQSRPPALPTSRMPVVVAPVPTISETVLGQNMNSPLGGLIQREGPPNFTRLIP